jgi:coenzyme F420-0:L-glutamate ligase/coenzyme F420-1:gamma-L-glutamate ligase
VSRYEVVGLPTDARVGAGDDVTGLLLDAAAAAGVTLRDGDVVCVASKVVSKAEGATAPLPDADDPQAARRRLALDASVRVVAETPWVLVVETAHGFVCANAGIDTSNVADGAALLLPADPDAAAAALRDDVAARTGAEVGVVITDTFGRPWRMGQTDVALGAAGVVALRDDRGTTDLEGKQLEVTVIALADELAAAADLARSKADGTPFVLIRGLDLTGDGTAQELVRPAADDVFRSGGPTTLERAALAPDAPPWPTPDFTPTLTERAVLAVAGPGRAAPVGVDDLQDELPDDLAHAEVVLGFVTDGSSAAAFELGRAYERARLVLEAHGLAVRWLDADEAEARFPWPAAGVLVAERPG